ncbi:uncharacterized protein TNCV_3706051 [Trichonephila clavipes]|nr:uncharacterized protein TNCV_3706051 [Trichonephila clavipes]
MPVFALSERSVGFRPFVMSNYFTSPSFFYEFWHTLLRLLIHILNINNLVILHRIRPTANDATKHGTSACCPRIHHLPNSSLAHCAQIKSTTKLIKIKELQIKYLQDLIEIETFDKDITDAAQLEALLKKKAQIELEFAVRIVNKLTFDYIKIQAFNIEEHRAITALLNQKGEEFYVIPSPADHPLKVLIRGLSSSTLIEDIKKDLTVLVIKVAQLTQRKSKFPLPIFMLEVRKNAEDAMDIYDVSKCCYMFIVIDPFKKRPGATQCSNSNYFNHSSANCEMKPICLKCFKEHRNGDCPINERIENPECINCKEEHHMAKWLTCNAVP